MRDYGELVKVLRMSGGDDVQMDAAEGGGVMAKCTGINCPMQFDSVDPANCKVVDSCQYATRPITRADHIRAMTDEELANLLSQFAYCYECPAQKDCEGTNNGCKGGILAYLKREVRDA